MNKLSQAILILDSSPVKDMSDHVKQALSLLREYKRETLTVLRFSNRRLSVKQYLIFAYLMQDKDNWHERCKIETAVLGTQHGARAQQSLTGLVARGVVLKHGNFFKVQDELPLSVYEHILPRNYKEIPVCSIMQK